MESMTPRLRVSEQEQHHIDDDVRHINDKLVAEDSNEQNANMNGYFKPIVARIRTGKE